MRSPNRFVRPTSHDRYPEHHYRASLHVIAGGTHSLAHDMPDTVPPASQRTHPAITDTLASRLRQALVEMAASADAGEEAATSAHGRISGKGSSAEPCHRRARQAAQTEPRRPQRSDPWRRDRLARGRP
jgi:hypothetical protein